MTDYKFHLPVGDYHLQIRMQDERLYQRLVSWYRFTRNLSDVKLGTINIVTSEEDFSLHPIQSEIRWEGNICHYFGRCCKGTIEENDPAILFVNKNVGLQYVELFFRVVTAIRIFSDGGVLVHAAGIEKDQLGYIFTGYSGAGKTTVCRLSEDCTVLNDDMVILNPGESGWRISTTPFTNPTQVKPGAGSTPLHKILFLKQDKNHHLEDVPNPKAVAELLTHVPVISQSPQHTSSLVSRCVDIIRKTPAKELHFLPDNGFWKLLDPVNQK